MVESVTEHFYASMGVNRLRGYLTSFGEGAGLNMGISLKSRKVDPVGLP